MRYVFISDVHGMYFKLIEALDKAKFNKRKDTLVCLGDMFDRGPHSKEVLEYIMDLPHKILVWGNHDRRLMDLIVKDRLPRDVDMFNGVGKTLDSFCEVVNKTECQNVYQLYNRITQFKTDDRLKDTYDLLLEYFDSCVWGVEFQDLIGVHGWIPYVWDYPTSVYEYDEDWREASEEFWDAAVWHNPLKMLSKDEHLKVGKKLLVGHIWSWLAAQKYGMKIVKNDKVIAPQEIAKVREHHNVIFIDGAANWPEGDVLTYKYDTDVAPVILRGEWYVKDKKR